MPESASSQPWHGPAHRGSRISWSAGQVWFHLVVVAVLAGLAVWQPASVPLWGGVALLVFYVVVVLVRALAVLAGLALHDLERGDGPDETSWPVFTVLLPVYREAGVLPGLVQSLAALDYPQDRLDAILLVEEDDVETRGAAAALALPPWLRVLVVPPGVPRTKPRACNAGLAEARGEFTVIYDAEDRPEADQLKKAVRAFRSLPVGVVCLQARLNYYNRRDNLLTRCGALEYAAWFDLYLPGLHALGGAIPLGGTSNHFRTEALRRLDGWDPWNVAEDCELGVRLARSGHETRVLDSTTWEEAVGRTAPWLRQRSRWVKGYWQTHLVHTRRPWTVLRELGLWRSLLMLATVGGQVGVLLANPLCWAVAAFWLWQPWTVHDPAEPWSRTLLLGAVCLGLSNLLFVVIHALAAARRGMPDLLPAVLLMPFYWLLISVGAWRGVIQSFTAPFRWEKTTHGVAKPAEANEVAVAAAPVASSAPPAPAPPAARRRWWLRWSSVATVVATLAFIIAAAPPLTRELILRYGAISRSGSGAVATAPADACWIGHDRLALTLTVDPGIWAEDRPLPLAIVINAKVDDGEWFETVIERVDGPTAGAPAQIAVSVPLTRGWTGREAGSVWGAWCLRRVREVGVRVHGLEGPPALVRLDRVEATGVVEPVPLAAAAIVAPAEATTWQRWEASFALTREFANPFDPQEVDVWGVFTPASGQAVRVPAFYNRGYRRIATAPGEILAPDGPPHWALRFMPPSPGAWTWRLEAVAGGASVVTPERPLAVAAATTAGPVRIEPGSRWFSRSDGSFFYPVALNIRSPGDSLTDQQHQLLFTKDPPQDRDGAVAMEGFVARLAASGISMGRVWLSPWFGGLEWTAAWPGYHGIGRYNLQNAWRIDRVMTAAESAGITIELALQSHGPFTRAYDVQWQDNPYNQALGGPLRQGGEVLTDPVARRWMMNRLRYIAARWGASPALFGWTLWIEVDQVNQSDAAQIAWHREAIALMRQADPYRHPLSTEFANAGGNPAVWGLDGIDYVQSGAYNFGKGLAAHFDGSLRPMQLIAKPALIEEYGGHCFGGDPQWLAQEIHDGLWLGWTRPIAATPMAWWWNFIFANRLERFHSRFAAFAAGQDLRQTEWRHPRGALGSVPGIRVDARAADDRADLWIHGPASEVAYGGNVQAGGVAWSRQASAFSPLAIEPGRQFTVPEGTLLKLDTLELTDGSYRVEVWDTWTDAPPVVLRCVVSGRRGTLALPALQRDAALRLRRE